MGAAGLAGLADPRDPARPMPIGPAVRLPTAEAVLAGRDEAQRRAAWALVQGATTVDEIVAVTGISVVGVLGAITRLEASGLVRATRGRYEPVGSLAADGAVSAASKPAA